MTGLEHFSENQQRALRTLAEHGTIATAASATGLSERTLRRYREEPDFNRELLRLRSLVLSAAVGELLAASSEAVAALKRACSATDDHGRPRTSVQVRAARALLELALRGVEQVDGAQRLELIESEIAELERQQGNPNGNSQGSRP